MFHQSCPGAQSLLPNSQNWINSGTTKIKVDPTQGQSRGITLYLSKINCIFKHAGRREAARYEGAEGVPADAEAVAGVLEADGDAGDRR